MTVVSGVVVVDVNGGAEGREATRIRCHAVRPEGAAAIVSVRERGLIQTFPLGREKSFFFKT